MSIFIGFDFIHPIILRKDSNTKDLNALNKYEMIFFQGKTKREEKKRFGNLFVTL